MVLRKLTIWGALAAAALLESLRRKDLWVAAILTVVNLLSVVLAVLFAARQLPEEVSRRTVYPLLARPISRFDLLFGKFLGAYALSLIGLLLFALIAFGAMKWFGLGVGVIFWQYLALRAAVLGIVCAVTMGLSVFVTPQAAVTLSLLLAMISQTFASAVLLMEGEAERVGQLFLRGTYFALPQFNLFDLSAKVSYGWPPIPAATVVQLFIYGIMHALIWLTIGTLKFRRQAL
jgi:ABC-type transport system involved in multi-copper enzyme maturation permease subunit